MTSMTQMRSNTAVPVDHNPNRRIPVGEVRNLCGGVHAMTIWRWLADPKMDFPRPIYIGPRRYWKEADILAWLESRQEVSNATA